MMHPLFANIISEAYKTSSLVNKLVIVVLVTLSVYTMFIIIGKLSEIKIVDELNKKFIRRYHGRIHIRLCSLRLRDVLHPVYRWL